MEIFVASLRRWVKKNKPHATAQRHNEQTKVFLRIIKIYHSSLTAWHETFKPHATTLGRNERKIQ